MPCACQPRPTPAFWKVRFHFTGPARPGKAPCRASAARPTRPCRHEKRHASLPDPLLLYPKRCCRARGSYPATCCRPNAYRRWRKPRLRPTGTLPCCPKPHPTRPPAPNHPPAGTNAHRVTPKACLSAPPACRPDPRLPGKHRLRPQVASPTGLRFAFQGAFDFIHPRRACSCFRHRRPRQPTQPFPLPHPPLA